MIKKTNKVINDGFSLMETLIWVGIVGIFVGLVGIAGMSFWDRAKVQGAKQEISIYSAALLEYYETEGEFPQEDDGLIVLLKEGYIISKGKTKTIDPWNQEYIYTLISDGQGFVIKSLGADKKEGGTGTKKDIVISSEGSFDNGEEGIDVDF